jgi:hypothetical protein
MNPERERELQTTRKTHVKQDAGAFRALAKSSGRERAT